MGYQKFNLNIARDWLLSPYLLANSYFLVELTLPENHGTGSSTWICARSVCAEW